jgi:hypothetical protein
MPRRWGDHMKGVAGEAVTCKFAMDPGAPLQRMRQGFEDDDPRTLADHEAVAVAVERAACLLWFVVAPGERPHRIESGDAERGNRRVHPSGDHHIGVAVGDDPGGVPDSAGARSAGRHGAVDRPLRPESNRDMAGGEVGQGGGDGKRRHLSGTPQEDRLFFLLNRGQATDRRADDHAGPFRSFLFDDQPGIGHGHFGGGQRVDDEIIDTPQLFLVYVTEGVEPFDLAGDLRLEGRTVKAGDGCDAGSSAADPFPGLCDGVAERRDGAHACYNHPSFQQFPPLCRVGSPAREGAFAADGTGLRA